MMLSELQDKIPGSILHGDENLSVSGLSFDSRKINKGDLFVSLNGENITAEQKEVFIHQAITKGAQAFVSEAATSPSSKNSTDEGTWLEVDNARNALAIIADSLYGSPSQQLSTIGVTGTNGKTTTAYLIRYLLNNTHSRAGLIGTVTYDNGMEERSATHTTPESADLQALLAEMLDNGCQAAVMEVSSHGLVQSRTDGIQFKVAIFTNLSQDHLDFHHNMESYFLAKRKLFEQTVEAGGTLVINTDDPYGKRLADEFIESYDPAKVISFGQSMRSDYRWTDIKSDLNGSQFHLEVSKPKARKFLVKTPYIGEFNAMNCVAALICAKVLGNNLRECTHALSTAPQIPGRLELVSGNAPFKVIVDYAHTPEAVATVLSSISELGARRVITILGCGGDRDKGKRAKMAAAAEAASTHCILTTDNPRSEDPLEILADMEAGMKKKNHFVQPDRKTAIHNAILNARSKDLILIAGKGHEDYQEINGVRESFDDRKVARGYINEAMERGYFRYPLNKESYDSFDGPPSVDWHAYDEDEERRDDDLLGDQDNASKVNWLGNKGVREQSDSKTETETEEEEG